jgi:hypothetical protein
VFTEANCRKAFEASGLAPINAQVVLDRLEVRLRTPTTGNTMAIKNTKQYAQIWIPVKASKQLLYSIACYSPGLLLPAYKGGKLMLHQNALQAARITELEEQLAVMTKCQM